MTEALKEKLQAEIASYEKLQNDTQKYLSARQMLEAQLAENTTVQEEMALLSGDSKVYKLIGPALIKQSREEAALNVDKRLGYIKGEVKRHDDLLEELESKKNASREIIEQIQRRATAATQQ